MNSKNGMVGSLRKDVIYIPPDDPNYPGGDNVYRREIYYMWRQGRKGAELQEIWELENLFQVLKVLTDNIAFEKMKDGGIAHIEPLDKQELAQFRLLKETLVDLYKLKYGEKKLSVNTNMGFNEIRDLMFKEVKEPKVAEQHANQGN